MLNISDVTCTTLACCIFALLFLIPGYVCGFVGDLFGFRRLDLNWRIIASVPLSVAVTPLVVYLSLAAGSPALAWATFALFQILAVALACGRLGHERPGEWLPSLRTIPPAAIGFTAAWYTVSILSLADIQFGSRLYFSVVAIDHQFRVAVTDAITHTGIPPASPFNHLSGNVPLRYHIFWFAVCSAAERLGGGLLNARHALNASVVWCGFALMCLIALFLRVFEGLEGAILRRRARIGAALLAVTGLDLIPNLGFYLRHEIPPFDMEAWGGDQVTSWADALLWVPHHVGAVVAGLTGFLLIWHAAQPGAGWRKKMIHATIAGTAFASSAGCSIYVGVVLAAALAAWTLLTLLRGWFNHTALLALAGGAAIVFALPNLLSLQHSNTGGKFLVFGLWTSPYSELAIRLFNVRSDFFTTAIRAAFLGLKYAVEFGFFLFVGVRKLFQLLAARKMRPQDAATLTIGGTALVLCTLVRSATISNNDFGWRGFMFLQFVLLLWATSVFDAPRARWLGMAYVLLLVGVAGTIYQLTVLRFYNVAADAAMFHSSQIKDVDGRRNASLRTLYGRLATMLPARAIVQANPDTCIDYAWGLYSHRQTASTGPDCMVATGGDIDTCHREEPILRQLFEASPIDTGKAKEIATRYGIDAVIVTDADAIWNNPDAWIYKVHPAVSMPNARAFLVNR
jgi:hypothetical protein